jgi:hypothetical protein
MTSVSGYNINKTACCGTQYKTNRYRSMNFMAWEYWTDGYRGYSLMPNDNGLRKCKCGNFYIMRELQHIAQVDESELPYTEDVQLDELPQAIAKARTPEIELAARLDYWHHLNHPYREQYRAHRKIEEAATKAAWEAENPDTRTWWQKLRKLPAPTYERPKGSPFTYPAYELTKVQTENLKALQKLSTQHAVALDPTTRAEIHRELGQFAEALQLLETLDEKDQDITSRLITKLAKEENVTVIRYNM